MLELWAERGEMKSSKIGTNCMNDSIHICLGGTQGLRVYFQGEW